MSQYKCKICGGTRLYKAIDLGSMPNANTLVSKEDLGKVKSYLLCFYWCSDCTFFQQIETAPRDEIFGGTYLYVTGVNTPSVEDYKRFAEDIGRRLAKKDAALVVASNDGTEIRLLRDFGGFKKVIGIDPAVNLAKMANEQGLFTINDFFGYEISKRMLKEHGPMDLVAAKGVFAHIPDPKDMLMGMKNLLTEDGTIVIEVHYLRSLFEQLVFESLYAEHYFMYDMKAMKFLANSIGLKVVDAWPSPHQGGSIRFVLKKSGSEEAAEKLMKEEQRLGMYSLAEVQKLQQSADERKRKLRKLLGELKDQGKSVSVWTAGAKVPTLLNFCGISSKEIDYAYDVTKEKIGKYMPMVNIEIREESRIMQDMPDYLILGSWNYADFAMKKLKAYTDKGGRFINPMACEVVS